MSAAAQRQQFAHRHAAAQLFAAQFVHFDEAYVAQHEATGCVVHAQGLRHVVERDPRQQIAPSLLRKRRQGAERHKRQRQQDREDDAGDDRRHGLERVQNSVAAEKTEKRQPEQQAGKPAADDHAPLAEILCQSVAADHGIRTGTFSSNYAGMRCFGVNERRTPFADML